MGDWGCGGHFFVQSLVVRQSLAEASTWRHEHARMSGSSVFVLLVWLEHPLNRCLVCHRVLASTSRGRTCSVASRALRADSEFAVFPVVSCGERSMVPRTYQDLDTLLYICHGNSYKYRRYINIK